MFLCGIIQSIPGPMNFFKHLFCLNIWNIGFIEKSPLEVIRDDAVINDVKWLKHNYNDRFFADPFLLSVEPDRIEVLVEEFLYNEKIGKITKLIIGPDFELEERQIVHQKAYHQSYPFVLKNPGATFVVPESSKSKSTFIYKYDKHSNSLIDEQVLMDEPLLDSTLVYRDNLWWLFAHKAHNGSKEYLYIYFAPHLNAPFTEHPLNPIPGNNLTSRPAGKFIDHEDKLYRISQISRKNYGEGIMVSEVEVLNTHNYVETKLKEIKLNDPVYNKGFHTLNGDHRLSVIDGLKSGFRPFSRLLFETGFRYRHYFSK